MNWYNPYGMQTGNMQQQRPVQGLVQVTGLEGAKAYQLPPNSVMPLFDGNDDIMYVKTTDGAGFPTIKCFSFQPIELDKPQVNVDYVTRSEFEQLKEMITNGQQSVQQQQPIAVQEQPF